VTCDVGCEKIEKKTGGGGTCLQGVIIFEEWSFYGNLSVP